MGVAVDHWPPAQEGEKFEKMGLADGFGHDFTYSVATKN
jgi:hypothetical protein